MRLFRIFSRSKLLLQSRQQVFSKRHVAGDIDNYTIKYPAATITVFCLGICAIIYYQNSIVKKRIEEYHINRTPLAERERDPDVSALRYSHNHFRPS